MRTFIQNLELFFNSTIAIVLGAKSYHFSFLFSFFVFCIFFLFPILDFILVLTWYQTEQYQPINIVNHQEGNQIEELQKLKESSFSVLEKILISPFRRTNEQFSLHICRRSFSTFCRMHNFLVLFQYSWYWFYSALQKLNKTKTKTSILV